MYILGISAFYHDSAAAIIKSGKIIAAAQEERFTRKKHDSNYPINAINYCIEECEISLNEVDFVVFYDKPFLKFERLLETYLAFSPRGFTSFRKAMPIWIKEKLFQKDLLRRKLIQSEPTFDWKNKLLFSEHHLSHAASAYYPSPFEEAVVLTMDGVGEWTTTSVAIGKGNSLTIHKELHFPHSLGLLYSAFTYYTGFKVNSGEYKLMGLAPYGQPLYTDAILENLIDLKDDGSFRLNMKYFDYCTGLKMVNRKFEKLFGQAARKPDREDLTQFHMDIAASIQQVTETIVCKIANQLSQEYKIDNLCLAGGVALNCVANGKLIREGSFKNVWIQPASGDAGGALGAALIGWHSFQDGSREVITNQQDHMQGSYLGPKFETEEIEQRLRSVNAKFTTLDEATLYDEVANALVEEKAVGWMQGRMEFGPRALGGRSIIGDPRSPTMQKLLNLKVKYRESFRPFAPSVLAEDASSWFQMQGTSPYMLVVADVNHSKRIQMTKDQENLFGIEKLNVARSEIPAVTHVDYSARIQTVHKETNPRYYNLIKSFKDKTACPIVVNTSFNVRGEPIVCTPEDAFRCFMGTDIEMLVVGNCVLKKEEQDPSLAQDYKDAFELD
ncbi:MAG: carbamoyltransferase [Gammaproteobacteria bacterium]|nr:carbamoyltransferase [Gammaproteobacteria bacterium]